MKFFLFSMFERKSNAAMNVRIFFLILFFFNSLCFAQTADWETWYERSGKKETPRYHETIDYCERLDLASAEITFTSFGKSPQGRLLPLLILDREGLNDPASIRRAGRIILLVQACIHAGEPDGKDAGLMLFRDIAILGKHRRLLEHVSILFIPIFNTDGHERFGRYNRINQNGPEEMGWRTTANNLNLNRDFLKADAPEMQAWLRMFNRWLPDFFIDTHTTDGADYQYVLTYLMEIHGEMDQGLTAWSAKTFIPLFTADMEQHGMPVFPYVDFRNWHDPRSGLITEVAPPMLSQGYTAIRNRPGLLIETHMLKPYDQRVSATYHSLVASLSILAREHDNLARLIREADRYVSGQEFLSQPFPLQFETSMTDSVMVSFKGIAYETRNSAISGGTWFEYGDTPVTFSIPYFSKSVVTAGVRLPVAYIVPAEWRDVIDRMELHGIRMTRLKRDTTLAIDTYRFKNPKWQQQTYEGRHAMTNIEYDEISEKRWFPAGSALVEVMQPAARIIPHILEPRGNGSYLYWGFFDAIMEQKEYGESYVLEKMAKEMLEKDAALNAAFVKKKAEDSTFMKNPYQVLNWFYHRTPYADQRRGIYPVGKISDLNTLTELKKISE